MVKGKEREGIQGRAMWEGRMENWRGVMGGGRELCGRGKREYVQCGVGWEVERGYEGGSEGKG